MIPAFPKSGAPRTRGAAGWGFLLACWLAVFVSAAYAATEGPAQLCASSWDEADRLFRGDPHWVGGDGAYSVDLGGNRTLWLFGDTLIDPTGKGSRKSPGIRMIGNSLAIQKGRNPATAKIHFYWKSTQDGSPSAFFPDAGKERFWPGHGIRIRDRLLVFLVRVGTIPDGLGFEVRGWQAALIRNPDDPPERWRMSIIDPPANKLQAVLGSAGVFEDGGFIYAYGPIGPGGREVVLARWPEVDAWAGNLSAPEWWSGTSWIRSEPAKKPAIVLREAATEFTVYRSPRSGKFLQFQCEGFGPADIIMRRADSPTGPWELPAKVYRPPEFSTPRVMIYQGKAHPELSGADLVLTYCTNSFDFPRLFEDPDTYYPRFVRLLFKKRGD